MMKNKSYCIWLVKKIDKYEFKAKNVCCFGGILGLRYILSFVFFFITNLRMFYICSYIFFSEKNGFWVHNNYFNLCGQVENFKWILGIRKTCVEWGYSRFLIYKTHSQRTLLCKTKVNIYLKNICFNALALNVKGYWRQKASFIFKLFWTLLRSFIFLWINFSFFMAIKYKIQTSNITVFS